TYRAISNCNVVTRKYAHVWDIDILLNHWATQPTDQMLTNQEICTSNRMSSNIDLQTKPISLLLFICFLTITKITEIDINLSNFNFGNHTALVTLLQKQSTNKNNIN
ncbi:MAG: hypothetical protein EZS28_032616, partial [Streblomastix strix]